jgi:hypothetical protein
MVGMSGDAIEVSTELIVPGFFRFVVAKPGS